MSICVYDRTGWNGTGQCPMVVSSSPTWTTTTTVGNQKQYLTTGAADGVADTRNTSQGNENCISGNPGTNPPPPPGT